MRGKKLRGTLVTMLKALDEGKDVQMVFEPFDGGVKNSERIADITCDIREDHILVFCVGEEEK